MLASHLVYSHITAMVRAVSWKDERGWRGSSEVFLEGLSWVCGSILGMRGEEEGKQLGMLGVLECWSGNASSFPLYPKVTEFQDEVLGSF